MGVEEVETVEEVEMGVEVEVLFKIREYFFRQIEKPMCLFMFYCIILDIIGDGGGGNGAGGAGNGGNTGAQGPPGPQGPPGAVLQDHLILILIHENASYINGRSPS